MSPVLLPRVLDLPLHAVSSMTGIFRATHIPVQWPAVPGCWRHDGSHDWLQAGSASLARSVHVKYLVQLHYSGCLALYKSLEQVLALVYKGVSQPIHHTLQAARKH